MNIKPHKLSSYKFLFIYIKKKTISKENVNNVYRKKMLIKIE
jgi:hypothetical protein